MTPCTTTTMTTMKTSSLSTWLLLGCLTCLLQLDLTLSAAIRSKPRSSELNMLLASTHSGGGLKRKHIPPPGFRPQPSDDLPIVPLLHGEHSIEPTNADLDPYVLRQLIGSHYDPDFMSVVRPVDNIYSPNGTFQYNFKKGMPVGESSDIRSLTFTLPGRTKKVKVKSRHNRRRIQRYLATYTYCPVLYNWIDLGVFIWPRWFKSGDCRSPQGRSCSIPAGMTCQPQRSTQKTLLYWNCRANEPCHWIPFQYPTITKCSCRCSSRTEPGSV